MKLFESKTRLKESLVELSDASFTKQALDMFGKNYLKYGKDIPSKDVDLILREQNLALNGKVISSNIAGQKQVKEFLSKEGWKFY